MQVTQVNQVTNQHNNPIIKESACVSNAPVLALSKDIIIKIFSYLLPKEISRCMRTCSHWTERVKTNDLLWKSLLVRELKGAVIDDFSAMVVQGVMTWKEVVRFSSLSTLFSRVMSSKKCSESLAISENPELQGIDCPELYMPRQFVMHGNLNFTITNSCDVKIQIRGNDEVQILKGESGKRLTHLAVDRGFLFTLRTDGMVIQWDYQKKEIVQEIQTAYVKRDSRLDRLREYMEIINPLRGVEASLCRNNAFDVQEGFVIIDYGIIDYGNVVDKVKEIIEYSNANVSHVIESGRGGQRFLAKNNKLFLLARGSVLVWDLVTQKQKSKLNININPSYYTMDIDMQNNILCASTCTGDIRLIDIISGKELRGHSFSTKNHYIYWKEIAIIENLLIGFSNAKKITVIDLNTWNVISEIQDFFDFGNNAINPEAFKSLVDICKNNICKLEGVEQTRESKCLFM